MIRCRRPYRQLVPTLITSRPSWSQAGAKPDVRSDIYALGCLLYQLLTGEVPFPGGDAQQKAARKLSETPKPVDRVNSALPAALAHVVGYLMHKNPDQRYQQAGSVVEALAVYSGAETPQDGDDANGPSTQAFEAWLKQPSRPATAVAQTVPAANAAPRRAPQQAAAIPVSRGARQPIDDGDGPCATAGRGGADGRATHSSGHPSGITGGLTPPARHKSAFGDAGGCRCRRSRGNPDAAASIGAVVWRRPIVGGRAGRRFAKNVGNDLRGFRRRRIARHRGARVPEQQHRFETWKTRLRSSSRIPSQAPTTSGSSTGTVASTGAGTSKKSVDGQSQPEADTSQASIAVPGMEPINGVDQPIWQSPTSGEPLDLAYLAPGAQVVLALRPAALVQHGEWEKLKDPRTFGQLSEWLTVDLPKYAATPLENIELVIVGLLDASPDPPNWAMVVHTVDELSADDVVQAWGDVKTEEVEKTSVYVQGQRAFFTARQRQWQSVGHRAGG